MVDSGLSASIIQQLESTAASFAEINSLLLFGSRARGDYTSQSDIDLAVVARGMERPRFSAFWSAVDDLPIIFNIDIVDYSGLQNEALRKQIDTNHIELYRRGL